MPNPKRRHSQQRSAKRRTHYKAVEITLMQYSAYLEMFMYAWGKLYYADSTLARQLLHELHPSVRNDIRIIRNFNRRYQGWLQQLTSWVYDYYLRQNRQLKGIDSYGEVTGWLLAYQKKYGRL